MLRVMEPKPSHLSWLMRVSKGVRAIQTRGSDRVINRLLKDKWKQCVYMQQSALSKAAGNTYGAGGEVR